MTRRHDMTWTKKDTKDNDKDKYKDAAFTIHAMFYLIVKLTDLAPNFEAWTVWKISSHSHIDFPGIWYLIFPNMKEVCGWICDVDVTHGSSTVSFLSICSQTALYIFGYLSMHGILVMVMMTMLMIRGCSHILGFLNPTSSLFWCKSKRTLSQFSLFFFCCLLNSFAKWGR